jgi:hypothetical protein
MNSGDTVSGVGEDRLRFIKHSGQVIFLIDFSHCKEREILLLLDQVRAIIARHGKGSLLTLGDFTDAEVDRAVATRLKEVLTLDRPYVKRSAFVGVESMPHVFYENAKSFSHRDIPAFRTREEAMDWLVAE